MDRDHAVLEALFERVDQTADDQLMVLLDEIDAEMQDHFQREEEMMRAGALPVLACHIVQHEMLKGQIRQARRTIAVSDIEAWRRFISDVLPASMHRHINMADRLAAEMLRAAQTADA